MRNIFIMVIACLSMWSFTTIAQTKNKLTVKVQVEDFYTETFAAVTCDEFDNMFKKTKKAVTFNEKKDLNELSVFMKNFKQIDDQKSIDVRGKITFYNHGKETTYYFDHFAIFYSNGKYFKNSPLLHFIGKKIFDDDLAYLDK